MTAQRRVFSTSSPPCTPNGQDESRFVRRKVRLKSRYAGFTVENVDSGLRNGVRTCTGPVQWPDSGRLSYEGSAFPTQQYTRNTHSSLPSPPPSCAWKLLEMNGPYRGRMRLLVCVCIPCEFISKLRHIDAHDEPRGLPASSGEPRLMWHKKLSRTQTDHDRGRETDRNGDHQGLGGMYKLITMYAEHG
jgi:hypothetical protein